MHLNLPGLSRSEARAQAQTSVFVRANQAVRALSLPLSVPSPPHFPPTSGGNTSARFFLRKKAKRLSRNSTKPSHLQHNTATFTPVMARITEDPSQATCPSFEDPSWGFLRQSMIAAHQGAQPLTDADAAQQMKETWVRENERKVI